MPRQVLGDLALKQGRKGLVVVLAHLAKGTRGGNDHQPLDIAAQNLLIEILDYASGEALFADLTAIGIAGAALVSAAADGGRVNGLMRKRFELHIGLVANIPKQVQLLAISDGDQGYAFSVSYGYVAWLPERFFGPDYEKRVLCTVTQMARQTT